VIVGLLYVYVHGLY